MKELFPAHDQKSPARTAVLLSGSGSNAEAILKYARRKPSAFRVDLLFTDSPETSRAETIARSYGIAFEALDICRFYAVNGEENIKLDTPRKRQLRDRWSEMLHEILCRYQIELVLFAGFVPLTNLTDKLPCLNVHPGDLTVTAPDGSRPYAGLHYKPVEDAICDGCSCLRSSVILAQPYTGNGKGEMDSGPVIGISEKIPVITGSETPETLAEIRKKRSGKPDDILRRLASEHIERMKKYGDHLIFGPAADDFAAGRFFCGDHGELFFRDGDKMLPILSAEYSANGRKLLERQLS